jgi:hypothetical protein
VDFRVVVAGYAAVKTIELASLRPRFEWPVVRDLLVKGAVYAVALFVITLNYKVSIVVMERLSTVAEIGVFALGVSVAQLTWALPQAITTALFSHSATAPDEDVFSGKVQRLFRVNLLLALVLVLGLGLVAPVLVPLVYGEEFRPSIRVLWYLLPGVFCLLGLKILNMDLAGRGRPNASLWAMVPALALNGVLAILWVPRHGALGAAAASSVGYACGGLGMAAVYCRYVGIGSRRCGVIGVRISISSGSAGRAFSNSGDRRRESPFVTDAGDETGIGGHLYSVQALVAALSPRIECVVVSVGGAACPALEALACRRHRLAFGAGRLRRAERARFLEIVRAEKPDVIHAFDPIAAPSPGRRRGGAVRRGVHECGGRIRPAAGPIRIIRAWSASCTSAKKQRYFRTRRRFRRTRTGAFRTASRRGRPMPPGRRAAGAPGSGAARRPADRPHFHELCPDRGAMRAPRAATGGGRRAGAIGVSRGVQDPAVARALLADLGGQGIVVSDPELVAQAAALLDVGDLVVAPAVPDGSRGARPGFARAVRNVSCRPW